MTREVAMKRIAVGIVWLSLLLVHAPVLGDSAEGTAGWAALEERVIGIYESVAPSVVNVTGLTYVRNPFYGGTTEEGTGSGFVYDALGHIITNYHVIEGTYAQIVTLPSGEEYEAEIVGADPGNDLAVLRIDAGSELPASLALADSDELRVGQFVLAIGTPFGLEQTLTTGIVSALGRVIQGTEDDEFIGEAIQTDAAINPGNSGGPLLDLDGEVIGVNSQILSTSGSSAGVGFAISSNTVRRVVPQLIANGTYAHPWIGVEGVDLNAYTVAVFEEIGAQLPTDEGVLVVGFDSGSPAEAAGLREGNRTIRYGWYRIPVGGDVIIAVDGLPVAGMADLTVYLETKTSIGDTVELTINRNGTEFTLPVLVAEQPASS
jgi:S1-C subfamily serine protease